MSLSQDQIVDYLRDRMGLDTDGVEPATPLFSSGLLDYISL